MRFKLLFFLLFCLNILHAQTPCENGFAGEYPCDGYDLMSHIPLSTLDSSGNGSDSWGWVDSQNNKEMANFLNETLP